MRLTSKSAPDAGYIVVSFTGISYRFFEDQFSGKHSYEQVCDILEQQAISAVDSLSAPTLDISVINQISYKNKKFVPERDKELRVIQRDMLNATGPLCALHLKIT